MKENCALCPGLAIGSCLLALLAPGALAQGTIDPVKRTSHAANSGSVNWAPSDGRGVVVGESDCRGDACAANAGWIRFGDGAPGNGYHYANDASGDYGVNHDGAGNLSGFAYGANIGWINFGWAPSGDPQPPRIDLLTGEVSGFASVRVPGGSTSEGNPLSPPCIPPVPGFRDLSTKSKSPKANS